MFCLKLLFDSLFSLFSTNPRGWDTVETTVETTQDKNQFEWEDLTEDERKAIKMFRELRRKNQI
jgi:hypothetical protein